MQLNKLYIEGLRNIDRCDIRGLSRFNLFYGSNGAGKSSLLEAVYFLSTGRSFRSRQVKPVIQSGLSRLSVFGEVESQSGVCKLSISKSIDDTGILKLNNNKVRAASEFAKRLPVVLLEPSMFEFLDGGPVFRRSFIDWGVFHVEHTFVEHWKSYQKALNQRNRLLKDGTMDRSQIAVWTDQMIRYGTAIDASRRLYVDALIEELTTLSARVFEWELPSISFHKGWPKDLSLADAYAASLDADLERGYTSVGPHRADLRFKVGRYSAEKQLSRGQQKMLIALARVAQGRLLQRQTALNPVYLFDDVHSELDASNIERLFALLRQTEAQIFMTSLEQNLVAVLLRNAGFEDNNMSMFHVEHGVILKDDQNGK